MGVGWVIFCALAIIAIIALVAWAIVASANRRDARGPRETLPSEALATLQHRYASGDIDEQEYVRRRDLLTQH